MLQYLLTMGGDRFKRKERRPSISQGRNCNFISEGNSMGRLFALPHTLSAKMLL